MSQAPDWLSALPFLHSQWVHIDDLTAQYPMVMQYDLHEDWQRFVHNHQALDWFAKLRLFRQSRLAYLAYHDLAQPWSDHLRTMHQVAALADHLIAVAYDVCSQTMSEKYGEVMDSQGWPVSMVVFALGKLGTQELNYSSDVDLVFVYSHAGQSNGPRSLDAASYFARLGKSLIKLLDHYSTMGRVYRVDMRLRPFGSAGPLVCSTHSLQQYLLHEGREWERFAWMRARMVCGQPAAGQAVMAEIQPFIYRRHLDYSVFSALANIKTEIAQQLTYSTADLKQGPGGIRAAEFIVQSLQMVFGGRNQQLQGTSISGPIQRLVAENKLTKETGLLLYEAWLWLRKVENICQAVDDQAVHEVPDDATVKQLIADSFKQPDWASMQQALQQQRAQIAELFNELFQDKASDQQLPAAAQQQLNELMAELPARRMSQDTREQVHSLLQRSLPLTDQTGLQAFSQLIKNMVTRPSYIMMLNKEANVHQAVLDLLQRNQYFATTLTQYPALLEQLFDHQSYQLADEASLLAQWHAMKEPADTEQWMEALRYFKLCHQFNVIRAQAYQEITRTAAQQQLTTLATAVLQLVLLYSWKEVSQKLNSTSLVPEQLVVIAYGSAAVAQMTVSSDLDLVFVLDAESLDAEQRLFTQKWTRRIIHHLNTPLYHGKLYDLDLQLRPNGNSGALVTTRAEFEKYQQNEAWIWEHAAMIKSRALLGTTQQKAWHAQLRHAILTRARDAAAVDQALHDMSSKLEQITGVKQHQSEFAIMSAMLKHGHDCPELTRLTSLSALRASLIERQLLDSATPEVIKKDPAS